MSYVDQASLKPVNSTELRSYQITENLTGQTLPFTFDAWSRYESYWSHIIIRNFSSAGKVIRYRSNPSDPFDSVPPASEREVIGWGSYFQVDAVDDIEGLLVIELVKVRDARA